MRTNSFIVATSAILLVAGPTKAVAQQAPNAEATKQVRGLGVNVNPNSWNEGEVRPALDLLLDYDPDATPSDRKGGLGARFFRVVLDVTDLPIQNNTDPAYYDSLFSNGRFADLWNTIEYLNSRGITHGIIVNVMGPFDDRLGGDSLDMSEVDAWTTFMAELMNFGINPSFRGLEIGSFAPFNEPDWNCEEGICADPWVLEAALEALSVKLDAFGLSELRFSVPDTAGFVTGVDNYLPVLLTNSTVMSKVSDFGLHSYGASGSNQTYADAYAMIQNAGYPDVGILITETRSPQSAEYHYNAEGAKGVIIYEGYDSFWAHHGGEQERGFGIISYDDSSGVYTPTQDFWDLRFTNLPKGSLAPSPPPPPVDTVPPAPPRNLRIKSAQ